MLGNLRTFVGPLKARVANPLARLGINPNLVTVLAIPMAILAAYLLINQHPYLGFVVGTAASLLDFIDGEIARLQQRASAFGNYLEAMTDRVVETALLVGLSYFHPVLAAAALGLSLLVSYAKPRVGIVIVTDNRDWPGVADHSDRMVVILAAYLFFAWAPSLLTFLCLFCLVGFCQRIHYAHKLIEEAERQGNLLPYLQKDS